MISTNIFVAENKQIRHEDKQSADQQLAEVYIITYNKS
jgi:hypothetical protein